jgi:hypothetical protein
MARKQRKLKEPAATDVLAGMAELVGQAVEAIGEAQILRDGGRHREAIDTLAPVGDRLEDALALHHAAVSLHELR